MKPFYTSRPKSACVTTCTVLDYETLYNNLSISSMYKGIYIYIYISNPLAILNFLGV